MKNHMASRQYRESRVDAERNQRGADVKARGNESATGHWLDLEWNYELSGRAHFRICTVEDVFAALQESYLKSADEMRATVILLDKVGPVAVFKGFTILGQDYTLGEDREALEKLRLIDALRNIEASSL
jgi:hypothetical protein